MGIKKNKVVFAVLICLSAFLSVAYFSCEKTGSPAYCDGILCKNGGSCLKGQCLCPAGYEDSTCSTTSANKYLGRWTVKQTIIGSDTSYASGLIATYQIDFVPSSTPTTFFINNFLNDNEFNKVVCTIDPTNTYAFTIDSTTNAAMRFKPIHFWGGHGTIKRGFFPWGDGHPALDTIWASFNYQFVNPVGNWQTDSLSWVLTGHLLL